MNDTTKTPDIADLELMTSGSVWLNEKGRSSRFLFEANSHLPAEHQKRFPHVAIYADEEGNIYAVPVNRFIERRTFYNVDPVLEARVTNLLADTGEDGSEEEFDLDAGDEVEDQPEVGGTVETQQTAAPEQLLASNAALDELLAPTQEPIVTFYPDRTDLAQIIPLQDLEAAVQGYQQLPSLGDGKVMHIILVRASDVITHEKLHACFSMSNQGIMAVYSTKVNTPDGVMDLEWEEFPGVFPCVYYGDPMYQLIFTTSALLKYTVPVAEDEIEFAASVDAQGNTVIAPTVPVVAETPADAPTSQHVVVTHVNNVPVTEMAVVPQH